MIAPRKPAAFRIEPEAAPTQEASKTRQADPSRKPRVMKTDVALVIPAEVDVFDEPDIIAAEPPPAAAEKVPAGAEPVPAAEPASASGPSGGPGAITRTSSHERSRRTAARRCCRIGNGFAGRLLYRVVMP
jgi:hypothetical protein